MDSLPSTIYNSSVKTNLTGPSSVNKGNFSNADAEARQIAIIKERSTLVGRHLYDPLSANSSTKLQYLFVKKKGKKERRKERKLAT